MAGVDRDHVAVAVGAGAALDGCSERHRVGAGVALVAVGREGDRPAAGRAGRRRKGMP